MMDNFGDRHILESSGYSNAAFDDSKMEVVKAFNNELVSLYDIKPPISKAKMTAITKAAIKSVKFYKHVVHGVEKFLLKCRPDYKIPGLYVIDSIIRHSRHQFGVEKDVFAARFTKNLLQTFKNICQCPQDDKQKIVRVINLWQKHKVFPDELLQKFLVMVVASENELPELYRDEIENSLKKSPSNKKKKKSPQISTPNQYFTTSNPRSNVTNDGKCVDPNIIQALSSILQQNNVASNSPAAIGPPSNNDQVKFDKKLLAFDYGEEEEEEPTTTNLNNVPGSNQPPAVATEHLSSILSNPEILQQLQSLQMQINSATQQGKPQDQQVMALAEQQRLIHVQQMQTFNQALLMQQQQQQYVQEQQNYMNQHAVLDNHLASVSKNEDSDDDNPEIIMEKHGSEPLEVIDLDHIPTPPSDSEKHSFSQSPPRSRSRSHSRTIRNRSRRSTSRDRGRGRDRDRDRGRDKVNEDRRRKALPPIKRKHLAVCSTTLWVGHLSKLVQQEHLSDAFGYYGDIISIDLIPPRGCAFLCMNRRQDADRALRKLKDTKLLGKTITIAWAPGKGMKGREWKDYWESDHGVSYIPWNKLSKNTDYDLLEDGGMLDHDTMPDWLKEFLDNRVKTSHLGGNQASVSQNSPTGMDMEESDDDSSNAQRSGDVDLPSKMSNDHIPLPDEPRPERDSTIPPIGVPLPPPSQTAPLGVPPPGIFPFGIPPRMIPPLGGIGGNFLPHLGMPPPDIFRLPIPPPFVPPGAPPLLDTNSTNPNALLSQIQLPDSENGTSSDFKANPFVIPPLIFPRNPNVNIDLPENPLSELNNDGPKADKNLPFPPFGNFPNFIPPPNLPPLRNDDKDFRSGGPSGILGENKTFEGEFPPRQLDNKIPGRGSGDRNDERKNENDRNGSRFGGPPSRGAGRNFDDHRRDHRDRDEGRFSRFGGSDRGRSPSRPRFGNRDDGYDNDNRRDGMFRRNRYDSGPPPGGAGRDFDNRRDFDYRRDFNRGPPPGGRDFRGGRGGGNNVWEMGGPPTSRFGGDRFERGGDRFHKDNRRDFHDRRDGPPGRFGGPPPNHMGMHDRLDEPRGGSSNVSAKRSRWGDTVDDSMAFKFDKNSEQCASEKSESNENNQSQVSWKGDFAVPSSLSGDTTRFLDKLQVQKNDEVIVIEDDQPKVSNDEHLNTDAGDWITIPETEAAVVSDEIIEIPESSNEESSKSVMSTSENISSHDDVIMDESSCNVPPLQSQEYANLKLQNVVTSDFTSQENSRNTHYDEFIAEKSSNSHNDTFHSHVSEENINDAGSEMSYKNTMEDSNKQHSYEGMTNLTPETQSAGGVDENVIANNNRQLSYCQIDSGSNNRSNDTFQSSNETESALFNTTNIQPSVEMLLSFNKVENSFSNEQEENAVPMSSSFSNYDIEKPEQQQQQQQQEHNSNTAIEDTKEYHSQATSEIKSNGEQLDGDSTLPSQQPSSNIENFSAHCSSTSTNIKQTNHETPKTKVESLHSQSLFDIQLPSSNSNIRKNNTIFDIFAVDDPQESATPIVMNQLFPSSMSRVQHQQLRQEEQKQISVPPYMASIISSFSAVSSPSQNFVQKQPQQQQDVGSFEKTQLSFLQNIVATANANSPSSLVFPSRLPNEPFLPPRSNNY